MAPAHPVDVLTRLLFSILATGLAPTSFCTNEDRAHFDGLRVDFTAEAVNTLGSRPTPTHRTFNAVDPYDDDISLDTFVTWLQEAGHHLRHSPTPTGPPASKPAFAPSPNIAAATPSSPTSTPSPRPPPSPAASPQPPASAPPSGRQVSARTRSTGLPHRSRSRSVPAGRVRCGSDAGRRCAGLLLRSLSPGPRLEGERDGANGTPPSR